MNATEAAWGLAEVVDENMANAARVHAIENGEDLSEYTMIAFGGAPRFMRAPVREIGDSAVPYPGRCRGGLSYRIFMRPFSFEANRSVFMPIQAFDTEQVRALFTDMQSEAAEFVRSCDRKPLLTWNIRFICAMRGKGGKSRYL